MSPAVGDDSGDGVEDCGDGGDDRARGDEEDMDCCSCRDCCRDCCCDCCCDRAFVASIDANMPMTPRKNGDTDRGCWCTRTAMGRVTAAVAAAVPLPAVFARFMSGGLFPRGDWSVGESDSRSTKTVSRKASFADWDLADDGNMRRGLQSRWKLRSSLVQDMTEARAYRTAMEKETEKDSEL